MRITRTRRRPSKNSNGTLMLKTLIITIDYNDTNKNNEENNNNEETMKTRITVKTMTMMTRIISTTKKTQ